MTPFKRPLFFTAALVAFAAVAGLVPLAHAAEYPDKPVRIIVPYAPGGGADTAARAIGQRLTEVFGQSFIVENRAGASTQTGTVAVTRAAPDGYTLLLGTAKPGDNAVLFDKLPYDAGATWRRSLDPRHVYVVVNAESPVRDLKGLIAQARSAKTGELRNGGQRGIPHWRRALRATADTRLLHILKGSGKPWRRGRQRAT